MTWFLSTVTALLVVWMAHLLASRRGRKEAFSKKLEEIYLICNEYCASCIDLINAKVSEKRGGAGQKSHFSEVFHNYHNLHIKMSMYASVYKLQELDNLSELDRLVFREPVDEFVNDPDKYEKLLESIYELRAQMLDGLAAKTRKLVS
ncbi:hypothetical protein KP814_09605 [Hahella sp. HN01]|nr:hypothetical protein [Hahella sp. HN01]